MLDFNFSEMAVVGLVALLVIGPKDLPKALRVLGYWVGKARGVARQFRAGFDEMVREAELAEMEKKWKEENDRIMREHPMLTPAEPTPPDSAVFDPAAISTTASAALAYEQAQHDVQVPVPGETAEPTPDLSDAPVMVERPTILPASDAAPTPPKDKAAS